MHGCCQLVTVLLCWLTTVWAQQDDSLRGALEAISRRQRDLSDGSYYVNRGLGRLRVRPDDELQFYEGQGGFQDDGQPEDIGYGYQKSVAPHTSGIFEPVALPSSELGSHDNLGNERLLHFSEKDLDRLASDYSGNTVDNNRFVYKFPRNRYPVNSKRSIFRERGDGTDSLQHLYSKHEPGSDGDSGRPILLSSSFRERYPGRTGLPPSALALIRNFGGLDRDPETTTGDDDSDEYLTVLNSIWEKYKNNAPEGFDPEELTESDVEELINYFGDKDEKKRFDNYGNNYDFFNSPLSWTKRSNQKLDSSPTDDGFFHALKFLSRDRDVLESLRDDDPVEDDDEDVAKVLLEQKPGLTAQYGYRDGPGYKKRFWRDVPLTDKYAYHNRVSKRFPVTKRSSNYPGSQEHNKSIKSHSEIRQRRKKNVGEGEVVTDPKVAQEINNIFSTSDTAEKDKKLNGTEINGQTHEGHTTTSKPTAQVENKGDSRTEHAPNNTLKSDADHAHHMHRRDKETGQKEESDASAFSQTLDVKKKSIDWSDYFGIDRRRKKSLNKNNFNDEWLLNQYLKAYSLSNNGFVHPNDVSQFSRSQQYDSLVNPEPDYEIQKKGPDDIDNKLRAMEDLIVDEALKYTGAHEGITDTKEVQKVKDRVMTKLAAAYSLEKMRRALGEFKSSIAAQKEAMPSEHSTAKPEDKEDQKSKRVAVKKEKAELKDKKSEKKLEEDNDVNYVPPKPTHSAASNSMLHELNFNNHHQPQDDEVCPVLEDVAGRCRQISIIAGDRGDLFLPLCTLHQICYLCGSEVGTAYPGSCDISFLTEANTVCHDNAQCRFAARRMLAGMRALKGDPSPAGCDWGNNPCLARFLALATDR